MSLYIPVGKDDHVQGPSNAPLTLVEYGDYQCPHCGRAYPIIKAIQHRLGAQLRFVFRNMPLNQVHPFAELAAEAAEAAAAQGKFWEMHDGIYEHQASLGPELLLQLAHNLKLDIKQFEDDLKTRKHQAHVKRDFTGGVRSSVNGTPAFFIDGERYDDSWDEQTLTAALLERL
ncbi:MAG TPA: DsbA family protein [Steroidobacteraceae bacterium]|jgi:protein-disulfide isomerase|nr:DsbA family protein [Steroidobacteraceae bacterium]